jgi:replication factor C subunit 2/4
MASKKFEFEPLGIWIYDKKPTLINEVIGNEALCKLLKYYIKTHKLPNLLLVGEHGSGKKTILHLFAKEYLDVDYARGKLIIDGAIDRGKDVISETVQGFAHQRVTMSTPTRKKLVIITNFDDMTIEAQNALRRIMELETSVRFLMTANNTSDIIEAIQSRCTVLKTKPLDHLESKHLVNALNPHVPSKVSDIISIMSQGDMKRITNYVQTLSVSDPITEDLFYKIFSIPPVSYIETILSKLNQGELVIKDIDYLLDQGHNCNDIMDTLGRILVYNLDLLPEVIRYKYLSVLTEHSIGSFVHNERLHMYSLMAKMQDTKHAQFKIF